MISTWMLCVVALVSISLASGCCCTGQVGCGLPGARLSCATGGCDLGCDAGCDAGCGATVVEEPGCGCETACEPSCGAAGGCGIGGCGALRPICPIRPFAYIHDLLTCQSGCGSEIYWDNWHNNPAGCDPCDNHGRWTGDSGCCQTPLNLTGWTKFWGYRYNGGCCDSGCSDCGGASFQEAEVIQQVAPQAAPIAPTVDEAVRTTRKIPARYASQKSVLKIRR